MKIYLLITVFTLIFASPALFCQKLSESDKEFNLIYEKIAIEVAGQEPKLAIQKADSLYLTSQTKYQQLKSLMLKAKVLAQTGDLSKSIEVAKEAEKIASETDFYSWQARIAGFISTQYRISGLYSEAKKYLDKSLLYSKKIKSALESEKIQSFIHQEKADIAKQEKNYEQAIQFFKESGKILNKFPKDDKTSYYLLATNDAYLADVFFLVNAYDSARYYYDRASQNLLLSEYNDPNLSGYIFVGLGNLDILDKNEDDGIKKIQEALGYADMAENLTIKEGASETLAQHYLKKQDSSSVSYRTHAQQTVEAVRKIAAIQQQTADYALQEAAKEKEASYRRSLLYIIFVSLLLVALGIVFIVYRNKKRNEFKLYQKAINELRQIKSSKPEEKSAREKELLYESNTSSSKKKDLILKETEDLLLKKLEKFERGNKFTDKNMSLSMLGGILGTNIKYLNYIISKYRYRNFNQYINHLRINYIIKKMEAYPEYLQYKISTLAEECGFSSHGKFTEAFKKEIGINPSVFIEYMQKERKKENG